MFVCLTPHPAQAGIIGPAVTGCTQIAPHRVSCDISIPSVAEMPGATKGEALAMHLAFTDMTKTTVYRSRVIHTKIKDVAQTRKWTFNTKGLAPGTYGVYFDDYLNGVDSMGGGFNFVLS